MWYNNIVIKREENKKMIVYHYNKSKRYEFTVEEMKKVLLFHYQKEQTERKKQKNYEQMEIKNLQIVH